MVDIIHRIGIRAPAAKVYEAVATARGVSGWWTRDTIGTAEAGGQVNVRFRHEDGKEIGQMDFEMTKLEPDREVRWRFLAGPPEWVETDVTFELTRDGDMTILIFGHLNWKEPGIHGALQYEVGGVPAEFEGTGGDRRGEAGAG